MMAKRKGTLAALDIDVSPFDNSNLIRRSWPSVEF